MNESQPRPEITVILTNYTRPHNISRIVENLRGQSAQPLIYMVDNAPLQHPIGPLLDRMAIFPFMSGSYGRVVLSVFADTEWVALMSDEVMPGDKDYLKDALALAKHRRDSLTGCSGRSFSMEAPHLQEKKTFGDVPVLCGHFMIFRKKILENVKFYWEPAHQKRDFWIRCDDIVLSLETGKGRPIHWADEGLFGRLKSLPVGGFEPSRERNHNQIREEIGAAYAKLFRKTG